MTDWSTLKKLIWLRIIKGGGSALRTVTGALIHVTNALAMPAEALTVNVEPIQAGTGDPSPDNVRPISGRTSATIYHSGADTSNPTTYTIQFGDTVYGGTLDVTGGKMVVDSVKNSFIWGDGIGATNIGSVTRKLFALSAPSINAAEGKNRCSIAPFLYNYTSDTVHFYCNATYALVFLPNDTPTDTEFEVVANLATPIEITLTPTQIDMLLGTNNLWSDAGDSTLTYYAEGEASTSEALGILLGGTYNNPGGADDASDDEALGILLGGS